MKIVCLGGFQESGGNCVAVECRDEAIVIDCGTYIPELMESEVCPSPDIPIIVDQMPNMEPLHKLRVKVVGVLLTHVHGDHMLGIPQLIRNYSTSVHCLKFTDFMLRRLAYNLTIERKESWTSFSIGNNFKVILIPVEHGIPEACHVYIETPEGNVYIASDWKMGSEENVLNPSNLSRLRKFADVDTLIAECVHADRDGFSPNEETLYYLLKDSVRIKRNEKAVSLISTVHINRVRTLAKFAEDCLGRKAMVIGKNLTAAYQTVATKNLNNIIFEELLGHLESLEEYLFIFWGPYGIPNSLINEIIRGRMKFKLKPRDNVVISASKPMSMWAKGYMKLLKQSLKAKGIRLYANSSLHIPNHAYSEEHRTLIEILTPRNIIPYHGIGKKAKSYAAIAIAEGLHSSNVKMAKNGLVVEYK